jgi:hypothetical protein
MVYLTTFNNVSHNRSTVRMHWQSRAVTGSYSTTSFVHCVLCAQVYHALEAEQLIELERRVYCPYKDCSAMLERPEQQQQQQGQAAEGQEAPFECPVCNRSFCVSCGIAGWHTVSLTLVVRHHGVSALRCGSRLVIRRSLLPCPLLLLLLLSSPSTQQQLSRSALRSTVSNRVEQRATVFQSPLL